MKIKKNFMAGSLFKISFQGCMLIKFNYFLNTIHFLFNLYFKNMPHREGVAHFMINKSPAIAKGLREALSYPVVPMLA